jgi:hypothetical protein
MNIRKPVEYPLMHIRSRPFDRTHEARAIDWAPSHDAKAQPLIHQQHSYVMRINFGGNTGRRSALITGSSALRGGDLT